MKFIFNKLIRLNKMVKDKMIGFMVLIKNINENE